MTAGFFSNMWRHNRITHLHGDPRRSLYHTARNGRTPHRRDWGARGTRRIRFYSFSHLFSPHCIRGERILPASDVHSAGIQQRRWCHSNTVNSFSRPALNSVITAAAQADVPAEIEHGMSDKMQGWRVTGC